MENSFSCGQVTYLCNHPLTVKSSYLSSNPYTDFPLGKPRLLSNLSQDHPDLWLD
jgi:hypothetical protein